MKKFLMWIGFVTVVACAVAAVAAGVLCYLNKKSVCTIEGCADEETE